MQGCARVHRPRRGQPQHPREEDDTQNGPRRLRRVTRETKRQRHPRCTHKGGGLRPSLPVAPFFGGTLQHPQKKNIVWSTSWTGRWEGMGRAALAARAARAQRRGRQEDGAVRPHGFAKELLLERGVPDLRRRIAGLGLTGFSCLSSGCDCPS